MPLDLSKLTDLVNRLPTIEASLKSTLEFLFAEFQSHKNDPAAIQALVDAGNANIDQIVADVVANTPAAEPPAPPRKK